MFLLFILFVLFIILIVWIGKKTNEEINGYYAAGYYDEDELLDEEMMYEDIIDGKYPQIKFTFTFLSYSDKKRPSKFLYSVC